MKERGGDGRRLHGCSCRRDSEARIRRQGNRANKRQGIRATSNKTRGTSTICISSPSCLTLLHRIQLAAHILHSCRKGRIKHGVHEARSRSHRIKHPRCFLVANTSGNGRGDRGQTTTRARCLQRRRRCRRRMRRGCRHGLRHLTLQKARKRK